MKTTFLLLLLAMPVLADSTKLIAPPKDSDIGRYEIHEVIDRAIKIIIKLDTKTGNSWVYGMPDNASGFFWAPITHLQNDPTAPK